MVTSSHHRLLLRSGLACPAVPPALLLLRLDLRFVLMAGGGAGLLGRLFGRELPLPQNLLPVDVVAAGAADGDEVECLAEVGAE